MLAAARRWGRRPTELLRPSSRQGLSEADRLLIVAESIHDGWLCPCGHGGPHYLDDTSKIDGWFEPSTIYCDAKAAADRDRKDKSEPEPGMLTFVRDTRGEKRD